MEPKKSQGPSRAVVAGSAAFFCVLLVGAAFFSRDVSPDAVGEQATPAASETSGFVVTGAPAPSTLKPILDRCEEGFSEDAGDGRTRTRCTAKKHPAFMMELISEGDEVERASMLVPLRGTMSEVLERQQAGLDLFGLVAGAEADVFLPREFLDAMGTSETRFVFQGRMYVTQPIPKVGLIFLVVPEGEASAAGN